jgi:aconitate hydratase
MKNSFDTKTTISANNKDYTIYSLKKAEEKLGTEIGKLPYTLRILLENLLRNEDDNTVSKDDINSFKGWLKEGKANQEIAFRPARVLMQDFTGVPAVVDLAAMRDAVAKLGADPEKINPQIPVDLVIDHSVMVDSYGKEGSFEENVKIEMERNAERYKFLKWGQGAFSNFRVVPPGTGICHQVNLEYLANVVWTKEENGKHIAYPDTLVGTDSHTTMINGLAVLGWGVGGIEAEAAMLGQPISMLLPEVIGFKLNGKLKEGTTATDLVLTVTQMLRERGVVGKFVEFFGEGLSNLPLADRATIANMAPEYGATCGFFPIDQETIKYLEKTARPDEVIELTEKYAKEQGLWREDGEPDPIYTDILELDMSTVEPSIAGPKRPQDKINLSDVKPAFNKLAQENGAAKGDKESLDNGSVVIAAITSCTNTSNPSVMIAAGLVAKKALEKGIKVKPWVKTSLAPGSKVVTEYLEKTDLQDSLDDLGFNLVGYGCTTCIGNSGPLNADIEQKIKDKDLFVTSVLSGNRNFEGRVHSLTKANYLMSPPLVVAYALAGTVDIDFDNEPIAGDVYLKDIWPTNQEVADLVERNVTEQMFAEKYADVFSGTKEWQDIDVSGGKTYAWDDSTYINNPPFFVDMGIKIGELEDVENAKVLAILGDSTTTDHISPAGSIAKNSPAAEYLRNKGVNDNDFNSYGSRRGNHEVMMRGTFANIRIKNEMLDGKEGGYTIYQPNKAETSIYDAAMMYQQNGVPLVIFAGKDYGMGSSRDWAAKGTRLLGVKAVIAESYERIHRSNLIGMGVLPLQFEDGINRDTLKLEGDEEVSITGVSEGIKPKDKVDVEIKRSNGEVINIKAICRIDTQNEMDYFKNSGILHKVIRDLAA